MFQIMWIRSAVTVGSGVYLMMFQAIFVHIYSTKIGLYILENEEWVVAWQTV